MVPIEAPLSGAPMSLNTSLLPRRSMSALAWALSLGAAPFAVEATTYLLLAGSNLSSRTVVPLSCGWLRTPTTSASTSADSAASESTEAAGLPVRSACCITATREALCASASARHWWVRNRNAPVQGGGAQGCPQPWHCSGDRETARPLASAGVPTPLPRGGANRGRLEDNRSLRVWPTCRCSTPPVRPGPAAVKTSSSPLASGWPSLRPNGCR